jgi:UDP-N-acetylmuramate--alanine ligase
MTRTAAEIGAGLAEARGGRPIRRGERIHVVGAAGAGASAALLLAHHSGAVATGCDPAGHSAYTAAAEALGLVIGDRHDPAHVVADGGAVVDRLAVTKALTAVDPDHAELRAAREAGIPLEPWQQVVADAAVSAGARLVAVAGTHGKSTTSGWLVDVLASAGRDPLAFVGALLPAQLTGGLPATARRGSGDILVAEADEYAGNFDALRPAVAVLLNAEWDHPDVFADEAAVIDAFEAWIRAADGGGEPATLVANAADPGVGRLLARLGDWSGRLVATALVDVAPQRLAGYARGLRETYRTALGPAQVVLGRPVGSVAGMEIEIHGLDGPEPLRVRLRLAGRHNAANALAVAAAANVLGVEPQAIGQGLAGFAGVGRRLELKADEAGVVVLDDYGHHPTAIAATLAAVRERYPGRRLWAVYEPLTYHRTAAMLGAFADVLARADRAAVAEIWAGRDPDTTITSAAALAEAVSARSTTPALAPGTVEATADAVLAELEPGDVVVTMGGGRSYVIAERLAAGLRERASR